MMQFDEATRAQVDAARPEASTWLGANAGSGKTRVLTDRVARLLLTGVEPQHILCLTYTKAAASEMQNRLFKRLGEWAMLDNDKLRAALTEMGVTGEQDNTQLRMARTLFASAIETPGGLKIQTIHSFCASLLRRFPLEARVSPQFTEIEDRAAELLRNEIVEQMAQSPDRALVVELAKHYSGEDFSSLTQAIVGKREGFSDPTDMTDLLALFEQPADLTEDKIVDSVFDGSEVKMIQEIIPILLAKGGNDAKAAEKLTLFATHDFSALALLETVFLTGPTAKSPYAAKIGTFPTKPSQGKIADTMPALNDLMERVEAAREARLSLNAAQRSLALHRFAQAFVPQYEAAKVARGWLDFDDLIMKARNLLNDPAVAAWVLYRIDGGIDHILVDEAQDTSPLQWDVIEKLTDEFFSGEGVREAGGRTLFVVGDKKQSIYSFQGADPREFDRKRDHFEAKITGAGQEFQRRSLEYSFRSSSAILRAVDTAFDPQTKPDFAKDAQHIAFKSELPGRVDLWPVVEPVEDTDDRVWSDPIDRVSKRHHAVVLAEQVASKIHALIAGKATIPDDGAARGTFVRRPVQPGDFLILVQRRHTLFAEIIRACKAKGLAIAGADRLKVGAELAVKDLGALLAFLATPDDDLSLATVLKSPIFGWSEQDLFDLSHNRTGAPLWQAMRDRAEEFPKTLAILHDLRGQVDFLRPYDLIERILTRHHARKNLLARLGSEAEDGINALLTQALAYERNDIPSLTGFLQWMHTDNLEIKRQIDSASNQIRVMTVHGSKGLEAPIVILPETEDRPVRVMNELLMLDGVPVWKTAEPAMPAPMRTALDAFKEAQLQERLRLLYVAMTRAEKWLIVAAAGKVTDKDTCWYNVVEQAAQHMNAVPVDDGLRFEEGDWDGLPMVENPQNQTQKPKLEPVFERPAPPRPEVPVTKSPSDLGGAKALPSEQGRSEEDAKLYGTFVHNLLEHLPSAAPEQREALTTQITAAFPDHMHASAIKEAAHILAQPALEAVFAPDTLAEVSVTGALHGTRFHGKIDRLIVSDTKIIAIDFKTNRAVPDTPSACPDGVLRQMGAYAGLLAQIYPDHEVETAILWTHSAQLMTLPHDMVSKAVQTALHLDAADRGS